MKYFVILAMIGLMTFLFVRWVQSGDTPEIFERGTIKIEGGANFTIAGCEFTIVDPNNFPDPIILYNTDKNREDGVGIKGIAFRAYKDNLAVWEKKEIGVSAPDIVFDHLTIGDLEGCFGTMIPDDDSIVIFRGDVEKSLLVVYNQLTSGNKAKTILINPPGEN